LQGKKTPQLISDASFPDSPGVYIVYANADDEQPLYVGVAATQSLAKRWRKQHLRPRAGSSALRRTLGVHLKLVTAKLKRPDRYYDEDVEEAITEYLMSCAIELRPTQTGEEARTLEHLLIHELQPLLNVVH
jgi:excinuclease UvrABC nuclease subunit